MTRGCPTGSYSKMHLGTFRRPSVLSPRCQPLSPTRLPASGLYNLFIAKRLERSFTSMNQIKSEPCLEPSSGFPLHSEQNPNSVPGSQGPASPAAFLGFGTSATSPCDVAALASQMHLRHIERFPVPGPLHVLPVCLGGASPRKAGPRAAPRSVLGASPRGYLTRCSCLSSITSSSLFPLSLLTQPETVSFTYLLHSIYGLSASCKMQTPRGRD